MRCTALQCIPLRSFKNIYILCSYIYSLFAVADMYGWHILWHLFLGFWWRSAFNLPQPLCPQSTNYTSHTWIVSYTGIGELEIHLSHRGLENWGKVGKNSDKSDCRIAGCLMWWPRSRPRCELLLLPAAQRNATLNDLCVARRSTFDACRKVAVPSVCRRRRKSSQKQQKLLICFLIWIFHGIWYGGVVNDDDTH